MPHVGQAGSVATLCGGVSSGGFLWGVAIINLARSRFLASIGHSATSIFLVSWPRLYLFLCLTLSRSFFRCSRDSKLSAATVAALGWFGVFARAQLGCSWCFADRAAIT